MIATAFFAVVAINSHAEDAKPNTLSPPEKAAGWQLLFDGKSAEAWRAFGKKSLPDQGWEVSEGWLIKKAGQKPGNIVTRDEFTDFEFSWEWRMARGGNNGVKYFVDEKRGNLGVCEQRGGVRVLSVEALQWRVLARFDAKDLI